MYFFFIAFESAGHRESFALIYPHDQDYCGSTQHQTHTQRPGSGISEGLLAKRTRSPAYDHLRIWPESNQRGHNCRSDNRKTWNPCLLCIYMVTDPNYRNSWGSKSCIARHYNHIRRSGSFFQLRVVNASPCLDRLHRAWRRRGFFYWIITGTHFQKPDKRYCRHYFSWWFSYIKQPRSRAYW